MRPGFWIFSYSRLGACRNGDDLHCAGARSRKLVSRIHDADGHWRLRCRGSRREDLRCRRFKLLPRIVPTSSDMGSGTWGSSVNYEYDPATDHWRELAPLPIGLSHVGVVGFNHKLYAFGGFTSNIHANAQNAALAYDPATNSWQWLPPLSSRRGSVSVAEVDGKIHVFGGRPHDPMPLDIHEVYDPATNQWTKKAPMPLARDHMGVAVIDGKSTSSGDAPRRSLDNVSDARRL